MQPQQLAPCFACTSDSTVYLAVADVLQRLGWARTDDTSVACLLLADGRKKGSIPWDELLQRRQPLSVNAFPKFSCITLKAMMARTIRIVKVSSLPFKLRACDIQP